MPGGLHLRLFEMKEGPLGIKEARQIGAGIKLRGGVNPGVDAAFMEQWLEQHQGSGIGAAVSLTKESK